jgi:hypothetical protein
VLADTWLTRGASEAPVLKKIYLLILVLGALVLPQTVEAQVIKIRDFAFGPAQGRNVAFSKTLSPTNELLSFIASDTGEWELYSVADWLSAQPRVRKLVLPNFFSKKDTKDLELLGPSVFVTRNGAYAVCVGSAEWLKRVNGRAVGNAKSDDIIAVVDLSNFTVVATMRTKNMDLFEFHGVSLDDEDYLRVDSLSSGESRHSAFIRLRVPDLVAEPRCEYEWVTGPPAKQHPQAVTTEACTQALKSRPLSDYLQPRQPSSGVKPPPCQDNASEFCRIPGEFTADGSFGVGLKSEGHDNIFGSWVTTSNALIVFSSKKGTDIAELAEPKNDSFGTLLAFEQGRNFLLVVQRGTHLTVYELRD